LTLPLFAHLGIAIWGCTVFSSKEYKCAISEDPEQFESINVIVHCMLWSVLIGWTLIAYAIVFLGIIIIIIMMIKGPSFFCDAIRVSRGINRPERSRLPIVRETINKLSRD